MATSSSSLVKLRGAHSNDSSGCSKAPDVSEKLWQLLETPEWISKVDDFLERESIVFDPTTPEDETYRVVYHDYKTLIDKMLYDWCVSAEVTTEAVWDAVQMAKTRSTNNDQLKELIQPLVLYENYQTFKEMMTNQNVELQLYVMESIQKQTGVFPLSYLSDESSLETSKSSAQEADDLVMQEVLQTSKEEYEELQRQLEAEEKAIEKALEESERLSQLLTSQIKVSVHDLRALVEQVEGLSVVHEEEEDMQPSTSRQMPNRPASSMSLALAKEDPDQFVSAKYFISPEELKRRQAYLRAQREKLQSKKEALRVAEALEHSTPGPTSSAAVSESRKSLTAKLKAEISSRLS